MISQSIFEKVTILNGFDKQLILVFGQWTWSLVYQDFCKIFPIKSLLPTIQVVLSFKLFLQNFKRKRIFLRQGIILENLKTTDNP